MEINLTAWLLSMGGSALISVLWFFFADRRKAKDGKSGLLSLLILVTGVLLGAACARLVWALCMISYKPALFALRYEELSYYGGMAGVIGAAALSAKIAGRNARETLNTFAPMGALLAALIRFAEGWLGEFGVGRWMEQGIFFPLTVEFAWDEEYSDFFLAVFMLEGIASLGAMVFSLVRKEDPRRWIRTLFYLCLPQILLESLRNTSIAWLFVRSEMLFCYLLCEGVLVWYALKAERKGLKAWVPAIAGLLACGVVIAAQFAFDGKILIGERLIPEWIIYTVEIAALAGMAAAEHTGYNRIK